MNNSSPYPPASNLIAYLRDSGGDEQDLSLSQQEATLRAWCLENGHTLLKTFTDTRSGSSTAGRSGFEAMLHYLHAPPAPVAGLLLWRYSRFAREINDAQFYKADIRRQGYTIHSLNDAIPEGPEGRLIEAVVDFMNDRFLDDLSGDVIRGKQYLLQTYGALGGTPPPGFRRVPIQLPPRRDGSPHLVHRWDPDPDTLEAVRLAWQMRATGATYAQIDAAVHLYHHPTAYRVLFDNRLYLGELVYGDLTLPHYCQPIIDPATWDAVQQRRGSQTLTAGDNPTHPRRANSPYLLSGLLRCAKCGASYNGNTIRYPHHTYRYYMCHGRTVDTCDAQIVPMQILDHAVLDATTEEILSPANLAHIRQILIAESLAARAQTGKQQTVLDRRAAKLIHQIGNLASAIASNGHSPALLQKLTELENKLADLKKQASQLQNVAPEASTMPTEADLQKIGQNIHAALLTTDPTETRRVLRTFIDRITVTRDGPTVRALITYYQPTVNPNIYAYAGDHPGLPPHTHKFTHPLTFNLRTSARS